MGSGTQEKCNLQSKDCIFSCATHGGTGDHVELLSCGLQSKDDDFSIRFLDSISRFDFSIRFLDSISRFDFWHHSRILAVGNAILSTGMGPIFKNVAPVREWCDFSKAPQTPAGRTGPGGQGRRGGKGTRNFDDFWGRKPIGNTPLE